MSKIYFEELPLKTKELVNNTLKQYFDDNCEVWSDSNPEEIECHSRSGFIPCSHNCGGVIIKGFTDLMAIWGSGNYPRHAEAKKDIERQVDYSFECLSNDVFEKFKDLLVSKGLSAKDCDYYTMQDLAAKDKDLETVAHYIENAETEYLSDDQNSIMYEIRFMYHGLERGIHRASVSVAVNTEGPYHRSHIPWAPNVFCEGAKEVEITWKTQKSLNKKLNLVLKKLCKEIL